MARVRQTSPTETLVIAKSNQFHRRSWPNQNSCEPCSSILRTESLMKMTAKRTSSTIHPPQSGSVSVLIAKQNTLATTVSATATFKARSILIVQAASLAGATLSSESKSTVIMIRFRDNLAITSATSCLSRTFCIFSMGRDSFGSTRLGRSGIRMTSTKAWKLMPVPGRGCSNESTGICPSREHAWLPEPSGFVLLNGDTRASSWRDCSRKLLLKLRKPLLANTCPRLSAVTV
mmetsp:Transcript_48881/g.130443  ORF Transcript_48881/g.130443 Transcript_48881/m.130443 type:complete len:233 (-) Transcript_48881:176-874(-)